MHFIWKILQYVYVTHTHNFLAIYSQVNGEYITACPHDDAVNILRNAGDIVVLTVKHYRAATPFLQKQRKCVGAYFRLLAIWRSFDFALHQCRARRPTRTTTPPARSCATTRSSCRQWTTADRRRWYRMRRRRTRSAGWTLCRVICALSMSIASSCS